MKTTLGNLGRDMRYTLRAFAKSFGSSAVIVATLALGIAASTAVFSIVGAIFLAGPPGIADASRLVSFYRVESRQTFDNLGYPDYRDFRDRGRSFTGIAAHAPAAVSFKPSRGVAERLIVDLVTPNYFDVLGARAAAGRLLAVTDDSAVVISYPLWQTKFGGDPGAIGSNINLNGSQFAVIGVAEKGFRGTDISLPIAIWVPLKNQPRILGRLSAGIFENRSAGWMQMFGRLKPSVAFPQASAEVATLSAQLARAYPLSNGSRTVAITPGVGSYPDDRAEVSGLLTLLSGAVALQVLIACANVAGLLLLRAMSRTREIAIRLATGATRLRIVAQLLTEGLTLALISGTAGVLLAVWLTPIILNAPGTAPSLLRQAGTRVDGKVLLFAFLATVLTGVLVALAPSVQSLRVDLIHSLKSGLPGSGSRRARMRSALVAGQIALSLVLLASAGLVLRGFQRILAANPGFNDANVGMTAVDLTIQGYSEDRGRQFFREVLKRLDSTPGIVAASLAFSVPPTEWPGAVSIFRPGQEPPPDVLRAREFELGFRVNINHISPGYFQTLKIALLAGRDFDSRDRTGAPNVAIVSRTLANKMWPGEDPIGKQIVYPPLDGTSRAPWEVIAVAGDVKHLALTSEAPPMLYVPVFQEYDGRTRILARSTSDPRSALAAIQRAIAAADGNVAAYSPQTGPEHSRDSLWQQRMAANWITAFGLIALLMAAVGLYSVIAQSVAQRTREVGIRMALGANPRTITAMVIRQGMQLALVGFAIGLPAASVFGRLAHSYLAGIEATDWPGAISISVLLAAVMLGACWIPARRAAATDPTEALRSE